MGTKINKTFGIQTKMGHTYDPKSGEITEVDIEDIAHALSNMCRYAGHCRRFYSVAEHSVLVSKIIAERWPVDHDSIRAGFFHDATEAYLVDLPTPIKVLLPDYNAMEEALMWKIAKAFNITWNPTVFARVKAADRIALATEVKYLFDNLENWSSLKGCDTEPALVVKGFPLAPTEAKKLFMREFIALENKRWRR